VAEIEEALSQLHAERAAAMTRLDVLASRRRAELLSDADQAAIAKLDNEREAAELILEKLDLCEPQLLDKLQIARGAARRAEWAKRYELYVEAAKAYGVALRATCDALDRLVATSDDARERGFESEWRSTSVIPPQIISRESCEQFLFALERSQDAEIMRQQGRVPAPAIPVAPPPVKPATAAPPPAPAPRKQRAPIHETAGPGQVLVHIIRNGYETPAGLATAIGDIIALPEDLAREVIKNGAADLEIAEAAQ
jgi:hypothetical protein